MRTITQSFSLRYEYGVAFTEGAFAAGNPVLADVLKRAQDRGPPRVLAVIDEGVARAWPLLADTMAHYFAAHAIDLVAEPLVLPGGEATKNDPGLPARIQAAINAHGICRHSYVVAVGGGALLDMAGYAAATAHRGVRLVRMPTTVLAQNDAGIGVKNGVNAFGKKNFVGVFAPPWAVVNDFEFLTTLDERDWRSGMAEAVKVALIRDRAFFERIEADAQRLRAREMAPMQRLIRRCAELHLAHIAQGGDPFEHGSRRPLDFGHWAAHRLEALSAHRLRHGEAVAIGIALDTVYSGLIGRLAREDAERVLSCLEALGFELYVPELAGGPALFEGLEQFREHLGGELTVTLLEGLGQGFETHSVELERYRKAVALLRHRAIEEVGA
jgi:3-dehydroquinate synthase